MKDEKPKKTDPRTQKTSKQGIGDFTTVRTSQSERQKQQKKLTETTKNNVEICNLKF